ncbi:MAG: GNAT family N-acetyltransferase [Defluviitaleaceae bacterium]|nr:GNAT family N-acetyltransferase [Defluviitaleaceae bacterium]
MSDKPAITIRQAQREDCSLILSFICGIAVYERLEDQVVATEGILEEWLFDKGAAEVLFAQINGREVAFAVYFTNFSTFLGRGGLYLEDVYVLPEFRGQGVGTAILRELARITVGRGYGRLEWSCLDWNTPSIEFYLSLGAQQMDEWTTYRLTGDNLQKLAGDGQ